MAVLCRPAVAVPEHVVTLEETLALARAEHRGHPRLALALRLIESTGVRTRHIIRPVSRTLVQAGIGARHQVYVAEAKARIPAVVEEALDNAGVEARDIGMIVYVSCTGFTMPSMTAWMIDALGFRPDTRQLPIAQLGCAAGAAAINRAHDFCDARPSANVLVVACEFCSLCYQPTDDDVGDILCAGLFADAVGAVVVRGEGGLGIRLERNASHLVPGTEDWISYSVDDTGFHFRLDRRVPGTMAPVAPALRGLVERQHWDVSALDFYVVHAGGPRILEDLQRLLDVPRTAFRHSWATLAERGNIASVVVLDVLRRLFEEDSLPEAARGVIAAFGPGITAEMSVGTWRSRDPWPAAG
ncbi:type III polyketide synthase [Umezawaea tangerina]|uniref:1,3,6,8-tetrahydroxynaphthalene synthase n=1 Tax=Umezawaea tangerina TaxID=84725 RepID=A0A2T0STP1_9PSEU|nr:type III polyketide synthase [Umezawaea tangerina]PRY36784.1 1,3,6,8-tetrahydroxynaphthalene synthase [Umezawaea tangerina]